MLRLKYLKDLEIALNLKDKIIIVTALKWHGNSANWKEKFCTSASISENLLTQQQTIDEHTISARTHVQRVGIR
jgi:hypothetical protein